MIWLVIILLVVCLFAGWLLFSPLQLDIDTRSASAELRWLSIGGVRIWYEEEWWMSARILFYRKTIRVSRMKATSKKVKKAPVKVKQEGKINRARMMRKAIRAIRTFRVTEWQLAVDTGDYAGNACLYPLNFLPGTAGHLHINFSEENFLVIKTRNSPWKLLYAFLR